MKRSILFLALAATALLLGTSSKAHAWGACHTGYTHVGYGGVQHYGSTTAYGPNGSYSGSHASAYGASGGAYHSGYSSSSYGGGYSSSAYHSYSGSSSSGYATGGYHYGTTSSYSSGVYRAY